jgi:hypothetical protein
MNRAALLAAALVLAGCEGAVIVVDDEAAVSGSTGPLYCPLEEDGCPAGDGVPSPVIIDVDGGAGAHETIVMHTCADESGCGAIGAGGGSP